MEILEYVIIVGFICLISVCCFIISYEKREKQNLESTLYYYRWHGPLFDCPHNNGWYLVQTDDNEKQIKVLFYNTEKQQWNYYGKAKIIAWCHLPNYLYPKQNIPNKV